MHRIANVSSKKRPSTWTIKALHAFGADPAGFAANGLTPFHVAVAGGHDTAVGDMLALAGRNQQKEFALVLSPPPTVTNRLLSIWSPAS